MNSLVIVESPAKAKTIEGYLGKGYRVLASYGHVRDLPPKDGSVDPDDGFAMLWQVSADRSKQLKAIGDEAKKADRLILATDPDREGEAISWHVREWLRGKKALPDDVQRVTFNAITKPAVTKAMAEPRALDDDLIDAYRARRALDYLVGFTLSPVLWRKLPGAKSAGRVQSVALRSWSTATARSRRSCRRNTGRSPRGWRRTAPLRRAPDPLQRRQDRAADDRRRRHRPGRQGGGGGRPLHGRGRRDQARHPQPAAALHHLHAPAGGRAQAGLFRQPHHAGRPVALRGGCHHLHADRRRQHGRGRDQRGAQGDRGPLRRRLRPRQAHACTRPRRRTRRRRTRRSGRPTSPAIAPAAATTRGCTSWSGSARSPARWRPPGWSARPSS